MNYYIELSVKFLVFSGVQRSSKNASSKFLNLAFRLWGDYVSVLRGNRRQFLVEKILSEEEECFDPHGKEFRFC